MVRGLFNSRHDLGRRLRAALGEDVVDGTILGHREDAAGPRLSILPLLSVGHPHADARVRRIILAEPFGHEGTICPLLEEPLNGKDLLPDESNATPLATLIRLPRNDGYTRRWYAGSARQWATVSPVLLPGFDRRTDKRRGKPRTQKAAETLARAELLIFQALNHAGVSLPCHVELSQICWWPGVPHARDFVPRGKLGPAPRYHVKLTFEQPFTGPLSLGRQRHMGLGVFAAIEPNER